MNFHRSILVQFLSNLECFIHGEVFFKTAIGHVLNSLKTFQKKKKTPQSTKFKINLTSQLSKTKYSHLKIAIHGISLQKTLPSS